ncbi:MAG TPA: hypothetical protein VMU75_02610 [Acidimicrobiales bacterium]|nr:hypothetical protein [Acidimicrobiales bacterium]
MRYERSWSPAPETGVRERRALRGQRRAALGVGVLAVAAGALALVLALGSSSAAPAAPGQVNAVKRVVIEVGNLAADVGAPAPAGSADASWALAGDPLGRGQPLRLARPEHVWVGAHGAVELLSSAQAAALRRAQGRLIDAVATGDERAQLVAQLDSIVAGEQRSAAALSSPGGVRPKRWYSVDVRGTSASADVLLDEWQQHDQLSASPGGKRLQASVATGKVEAKATLQRTGGAWRVATLVFTPWQQPT